MRIWPAIDLRGGRSVRLEQGDFDRETVFDDDPVRTARQWVAQGAQCLHLVDLDGARSGTPSHLSLILQMVAASGVPCQVGGGVRDERCIGHWLDAGVERVVIGTRAVAEPNWFAAACRKFPGRLVLGLDARDGFLATEGWESTSRISAIDLAQRFQAEPLAGIVYTDIARDGMLVGPNFAALESMIAAIDLPVTASGGVATLADVVQLAALGVDGCIVGRALYEGRIQLSAALAAALPAPAAPN